MKTLNMDITLTTYNELSDNGELNPPFIRGILEQACQNLDQEEINKLKGKSYKDYNTVATQLPDMPEAIVKYTLKIDDEVHHTFKQLALDERVTLSEISGRIFVKYYNEVK